VEVLNFVIKLALRQRVLVVVLSLVAMLYGAYATTTLPIDVLPDLDRPRVTVMTECHGLAPEEVETLVTYPLESALLGANGVRDVRSQSGFGLSVVYVEFDWSMDIREARQIVQERLATVTADMPEGVRPQMAPVSSIMGQVAVTGLRRQPGPKGGELVQIQGTTLYAERVAGQSLHAWQVVDRRDPATWTPIEIADVKWETPNAEGDQRVRASVAGQVRDIIFPSELKRQLALRTLADWVVRPRLLKESGIAQVVAMGGGRKQYQVLVDPTALHEYGVSLQDVEEALKANNINFSGGYATIGDVEKPVRVIGRLGPRSEQVVADLRKIPIKSNPQRTILLEQVAQVVEGPQIKRGDASINGYPAVALTIK
jgi:HME family heavy-metal exporter